MQALYSFIWIFVCALLQVLVFNHLNLFGGVVLLYLFPMIKMPVEINRELQILFGFICGLIVDIFSNTPGMHALTCTTIMWLRLPILHLFVVAEEFKAGVPSMLKLSTPVFTRFALMIVSIHCVILYLVESFTLFNFLPLLLKIVISILLTSAFVFAMELATKENG